jgi:hypothetical protein
MTRTEHLLFILSEECNEVAHRASKAARFGLDEKQPDQWLTNAERIVAEYSDLVASIEMLVSDGLIEIDQEMMRERIKNKKAAVEKFPLYSAQCGTLTPTEST